MSDPAQEAFDSLVVARWIERAERAEVDRAALVERAKTAEAQVVQWRERYTALRSAAAKACYEHHMNLGEVTPGSLERALIKLSDAVRDG